jgi:hypothetical protein
MMNIFAQKAENRYGSTKTRWYSACDYKKMFGNEYLKLDTKFCTRIREVSLQR